MRNVRYWIPCFVGSILCIFTAIFTWVTAPETLPREVSKKAREDKKRNASRVVKIKEKKSQGQTLTNEEEMLLVLSRDGYLDLLFDKRVLITTVLYGMFDNQFDKTTKSAEFFTIFTIFTMIFTMINC